MITNADTRILKNEPEIKRNFIELLPSKRLTYAVCNSQNNQHLEVDNGQDAADIVEDWKPTLPEQK